MADQAPLIFEHLGIRKMHGFRPPGLRFRELSAGINVVYGRNASGKSTMARAFYRLLWPEAGAGDEQLTGRFLLDGDEWRVEVDAGRILYQCNGEDAGPPQLPARDLNDRYHLYLQDLLTDDDRDFARAIQQAARGGYDVAEAADQLDFANPRPRAGATTRRVEEAREAVQECRRRQKELRAEERKLEEVRAELSEAREAKHRLEVLEAVQAYADHREKLREAERELAEFPEVMQQVEGDERERARSLRKTIEAAEGRIREAEERKSRAADELRASPIPEGGLPDGLLESLSDRVTEVRECSRRIGQLRSDLEDARQRADTSWDEIGGAVDRNAARELEVSEIGDIGNFVADVHTVEMQRKYVERIDEAFGDADDPSDAELDEVRDGMRHLRRWLARPAHRASKARRRARWLTAASAIVLGAVSLALGAAIHPALYALLVLAGVVAVATHLLARGASEERQRRDHRRQFERLDLDEPSEWSEEAVERRVRALSNRHSELKLERRRASIAAEAESERRDLEAQSDELDARREELASQTGLDPETEPAAFQMFLAGLRRWRKAREDAAGRRADLDDHREQLDELLVRISDDLDPYFDAKIDDVSDAAGRVEALREARDAFREARREHDRAAEELEEANSEVEAAREERARLFEKLGLEPGETARLAELCDRREAFDRVSEEKRHRQRQVEEAREGLEEREAFEDELVEWSRSRLDGEIAELRRRTESIGDLKEEKGRLERDLEQARRSHDLEEALAEYRDAREALRRERERDFRRAAGAQLADFLHEETRERQLPEVFHRARTIFSEITRGRYRLLLADGAPPEFRAKDEVLERGFALDELSEGTRVQLLLAVRIAFLEAREESHRLPVVFDETLATTDDARAEAVLRAIERIAERGRQIFYLTAQQDEVAKWQARLKSSDVPHRFFRVEEARGDGRASIGRWQPDLETPVPTGIEEVPPPEGRSHDSYGELLEVPDWNPREATGALHLWYLLDDPESLFRCLEAGVHRWGQLRHLHEHGGLAAIGLDEELFTRARALARVVEAYSEAWSVGRGEPVDRGALQASGAVTENFIEQVSELCEAVDGDAEAILRGLEEGEVSGFRTNKRKELEEFFRREGYLSPEEPLTNGKIWERILAAAAGDLESNALEQADLVDLLERITGERLSNEPERSLASQSSH